MDNRQKQHEELRTSILKRLQWIRLRIAALDKIEMKLKSMRSVAVHAAEEDVTEQERKQLDVTFKKLEEEVQALDTLSRQSKLGLKQ